MKAEVFDAMAYLNELLSQAHQESCLGKVLALNAHNPAEQAVMQEQEAAIRQAKSQSGNVELVDQTLVQIDASQAGQLQEVLKENERLKRKTLRLQESLDRMTVSQMTFKDLACTFGIELGIPREKFVESGILNGR